ncbi:MAG: SPFH domain-containing protein, partial [Verrucomicrobia bacterium]|nr:SPFH domain-containing protein [Verrucomicrobiota bacterium]
ENDAGLKIKAPFLENVIQIDKRNQTLEADQEEVIASDQERLVVDSFIRYRISNPLQYYRTLRDERTAADRIERLVNSSQNSERWRRTRQPTCSGALRNHDGSTTKGI